MPATNEVPCFRSRKSNQWSRDSPSEEIGTDRRESGFRALRQRWGVCEEQCVAVALWSNNTFRASSRFDRWPFSPQPSTSTQRRRWNRSGDENWGVKEVGVFKWYKQDCVITGSSAARMRPMRPPPPRYKLAKKFYWCFISILNCWKIWEGKVGLLTTSLPALPEQNFLTALLITGLRHPCEGRRQCFELLANTGCWWRGWRFSMFWVKNSCHMWFRCE